MATELVLYSDDTTIIKRQSSISLPLERNISQTITSLYCLQEQPEQLIETQKYTLAPLIIGLKNRLSGHIYALKHLCGELDQDIVHQPYFLPTSCTQYQWAYCLLG